MDFEGYAPLCCVAVAAIFGGLTYAAVVMNYRRQHESEIERKQRERRERQPNGPDEPGPNG